MQLIKEIGTHETFPVRHAVLRPGKPIESCSFDGDNLETTHHYGLFNDGKVIGVITIMENKSQNFLEQIQFQIRGMAILEQFSKKGYGQELLLYAENQIKALKGELIWFSARETAVGFYQKSGYEISGSLFEIPAVGPHYIMFKKSYKPMH